MKKISKCVSVLLVISIILGATFIPNNNAFAQEGIHEPNQKQNLKIISDDLNNFIYTYEENGVNYKVIEKIDTTNEEVYSSIYKQNGSGNYELDSIFETNVIDNTITIKETTSSGKNTIDKFDLTDNEIIDVDTENSSISIMPQVAPSPWSKETVGYSTNTLTRLTIGIVATVIATKIATYVIGVLTIADKDSLMNAASYTAGFVVGGGLSKIYYKTYSSWRMHFNKKEHRTRTYLFKDSGRTKLIDIYPIYTYTFRTIHM